VNGGGFRMKVEVGIKIEELQVMDEGCIVYLICVKKINPVGDKSFHNYRRLPASSFFWFGCNTCCDCCDCDRMKTESTPRLLTTDLVEV
jgi:hypothetical protein